MSFGFGMGFTRNDPFAGGPSLNLQFVGNTVLDPSITFTRALNTATYFNSEGLLTTANANVARFDYDPSTLAPRGLLIEEARTNTLLQSRDMTQAAWTKTDVTPNRNQVGLDGVANTATLLTEGSAGTAITSQDGAAVTAGSTITASFVVKRGNTDWIRVGATGGGFTNGADGWFNLATGAKGSVTARGTGTSNSSTITNLGGGWYRCAVTTVPDATYTVPKAFIVSASANGSGTRVANSTYIVDCAQLEVGAFATSVIPTTTTTLTRNADVASVNTLSPWFNATEGTLYAEVQHYAPSAAVQQWQAQLASTSADYYGIYKETSPANITTRVRSGGADQAFAYTTGAISANTTYKTALGYAVNNLASCTNGGTVFTDATVTLPTSITTLGLGQPTYTTSVMLNGYLRRITYYPRRLSNAELQAITA